MKDNILVFDVESTSLHGKGFAVGAVVINKNSGKEIDSFILRSQEGEKKCNEWVNENVLPSIKRFPSVNTNFELRHIFWQFLNVYKENSDIWVDVGYPVETNFLESIYEDDSTNREFSMPYPLYDISTIVPIEIDRNSYSELKSLSKHNPYDDARASAYSLLKHLSLNDEFKDWGKIKETSEEIFLS